jgi:hypothetical protein
MLLASRTASCVTIDSSHEMMHFLNTTRGSHSVCEDDGREMLGLDGENVRKFR